jgi:plastocyanin domain-containing protein
MSLSQLLVTASGLAAIAWVNWYFLIAKRKTAPASSASSGPQVAVIEVNGGYDPDRILVQAGRPVRLEFHRVDTGSCSEEVVLGDFGIRAFLPTGRTTPVEFTPMNPGTYEFTCGMGMLRGNLVVTSGQGSQSEQ